MEAHRHNPAWQPTPVNPLAVFGSPLARGGCTLRWTVLLKSPDALVSYGVAVNEVSVVLRKSGTDMRIAREEWQSFLSAEWREKCRPGLERDAVAELIPALAQLSLPQSASPNGGPATLLGNSGVTTGPPSVS